MRWVEKEKKIKKMEDGHSGRNGAAGCIDKGREKDNRMTRTERKREA